MRWDNVGISSEGINVPKLIMFILAVMGVVLLVQVYALAPMRVTDMRLANLEKFANDAAPVIQAIMQRAQQAKQQDQQSMVQQPMRQQPPVVEPAKPTVVQDATVPVKG